MKLIYNRYELEKYISLLKKRGEIIGFVPTMGALHAGHISLVKKAKLDNDVCICSIFVNPTQFNNKEDFKNYPRSLESDIELFDHEKADAVFIPSEKEMYPGTVTEKIFLGGLKNVMEGKFRPGHFIGVAIIVRKFFDLIKPDRVYFGEKDFQQVSVIKYLVKHYGIPVEIITCPTIREKDGLAMSSRNRRLNAEERMAAPLIYKTLCDTKGKFRSLTVEEIKKLVEYQIGSCNLMKLEYFEIVDSEKFIPVSSVENHKYYTACIAVYVGKIRLIDNIKFL